MPDLDGPKEFAAPEEEIRHLRAGEEGGWSEGVIPTPGQYLKRLHELDGGNRIQNLTVLLGAAEAGHQCAMSLHEANLSELRQRTMTVWSALSRIGELCQGREGLVDVRGIVDLLPEALRRG